jgi:DNA-binding NtrC family response regulator
MSLKTRDQATTVDTEPSPGLTLRIPGGTRILIVNDDNSETERLKTLFAGVGFMSETAKGMTDACEAAKSGRFQVVVSVPLMSDGSWRRLIDVANHHDLGFEVILLARNFDLTEWVDASLNDGAFEVLDPSHELPKAAQAAACASWAAYLRSAGPPPRTRPKAASPQQAA